MKSIICRQDSTRIQVVFLLDTLNHETQTLEVWKGGEAKTETVNVDFYRSTRSVSDADELTLAKKFVEQFKVKDGIILRRRLYKAAPVSGAATKHMAYNDEHFDKDTYLDKLSTTLAEKMLVMFQNSIGPAIQAAISDAA